MDIRPSQSVAYGDRACCGAALGVTFGQPPTQQTAGCPFPRLKFAGSQVEGIHLPASIMQFATYNPVSPIHGQS